MPQMLPSLPPLRMHPSSSRALTRLRASLIASAHCIRGHGTRTNEKPIGTTGWIPGTAQTGFARLDAEPFPVFEPGWVWLVGAGPGAPGLMSLLCYHALQNCDVVVYDALVNPDILRWVSVGAELEYAGKRGGKPSPTQRDITLRLIDLAQAGKRVLRLKGGDPFMFGRGGEECQNLARRAHSLPHRPRHHRRRWRPGLCRHAGHAPRHQSFGDLPHRP